MKNANLVRIIKIIIKKIPLTTRARLFWREDRYPILTLKSISGVDI